MASALFQGASIGPLIDLAVVIDPRYASIVIIMHSDHFWLLQVSVFSTEL